MPLTLFDKSNIAILLVSTSLLISGCQSIPDTMGKSEVIQKVLSYDQELSGKNLDELNSIEVKLQNNKALTETEAVLIALNHNAGFRALLTDLNIAKADLINAGLLPNPDLLFAFGVANKPYRYAIDLPIEALWLRPIKLRTMKSEADANAFRLAQAGINLIKDVRVAYAQAILAQEQRQVAETSHQLRNRIYELSLKRLEAGDLNGKDILLAQNDAAVAKRDWELTRYDLDVKMHALLYLLGMNQKYSHISTSPSLIPACSINDVDSLLTSALAQRPDLLSAEYSVNASKEKIKLSKMGWLKFTATADATSGLRNGHTLGPAIRSVIPIANQNEGAIGRSEAELEKAELNLEALKQQAVLEIKTAHTQYQQTCHDWRVLQDTLMPSMQEAIKLTDFAYQKGDISFLQTLEANRQYVDAQMRSVQLKALLVARQAELMRNQSAQIGIQK